MKSKIFAKLKQAYSPLGLGDDILLGRAEALANTGLVTDDNIDLVVSVQKSDLENLQKLNDKRVTDALEKERKRREEEEAKRKEQEAKAAAEEAEKAAKEKKAAEEAEKAKAEKEAAEAAEKKAGDDEAAKLQAELDKLKESGAADAVIEYLKLMQANEAQARKAAKENAVKERETLETRISDLLNQGQKHQAEYLETLKALKEQNEALKTNLEALKTESEAAKAAKAQAERQAFILNKARELGVPQWRIDEGFVLDSEASEEIISEALAKVANNIRTEMLPTAARTSFPQGSDTPSKEDVEAFAKSIVK